MLKQEQDNDDELDAISSLGLPDKEETKGIAIDFSKLENEGENLVSESPAVVEFIKKFVEDWEKEILEGKAVGETIGMLNTFKLRLRPKALISQNVEGITYELYDDYLKIKYYSENSIEIEWKGIKEFIADLQEVQKIVGE